MSSSSSSDSSSMEGRLVLKGRRTKRHRLGLHPPSSTTTTTEEEEDTAKCLILLARGRAAENSDPPIDGDRVYVYECKTCAKRFPSFQALGGHRASHKKPKTSPAPAESDRERNLQVVVGNHEFNGTHKSRVHECSICGSEFSSGQALGGHMRRHRPVGEAKKEKINHPLFSLDLNLPAPSDDERPPETVVFPANSTASVAFPFSPRKQQPQPLLFTATALVDCHY